VFHDKCARAFSALHRVFQRTPMSGADTTKDENEVIEIWDASWLSSTIVDLKPLLLGGEP